MKILAYYFSLIGKAICFSLIQITAARVLVVRNTNYQW